MSEKEQRSATDVILSLENKVELLLRQASMADVNIKLILNHLNLLTRDSVRADKPLAPMPRLIATKASVEAPEVSVEAPEASPVVFPEASVGVIAQSTGDISNRKSPVQQKIVYKDQRPVILAKVIIADAMVPTNIIHETRTDAHGKWHTELLAGKYIVKIKKGPTAVQPAFIKEYSVDILPGGKPLSLERKQII